MNIKHVAIAIIAGMASVLALFAASGGGGIVLVGALILIAPLPVYLSVFAWGTRSGIITVISAIVIVSAISTLQATVNIGLMIIIPAAIIGHQVNLAQNNRRGSLQWYPLSRLLFNLALVLSVALSLSLIWIGDLSNFTNLANSPEFKTLIQEVLKQNPQLRPLSEEEIAAVADLFFHVLLFMTAGLLLIVHVVNACLAGIICRASNSMPRPRDDLPATVTMPSWAIAIPFAALAGMMFFEGNMALVFSVIAGAFVMAFALVGLAWAHLNSRNNVAGLIFLILCYVFIMILFLSIYLFAIGGIIRSLSGSNHYPENGTSNND